MSDENVIQLSQENIALKEEVKEEPKHCEYHPIELIPCPICAKLEAEGKALAATRRVVRARRTYEWGRSFYDAANARLAERVEAQRHIIDSREARVKAQKEKLALEREKRNAEAQTKQ